MAVSDEEVDRLFQLPIEEFTPARNALAKTAGPDGPAIKRLHRPHAAAWAVNQLYWKRRKAYDRLIAASERLRSAHAGLLSGKKVDLAAAEQAHREALKAAMDDIRALTTEAGEKATPATLTAVNETLQALPREEPPGRLVRPLKPLGFEALSGLMGGGAIQTRRPAEVVPFERGRRSAATEKEPEAAPKSRQEEAEQRKREEKERAREEEARKREAARLEKQVAAAKSAERDAQKELTQARNALERAERAQERAQEELKAATEQVKRLTAAVEKQQQVLTETTAERTQLERELRNSGY